MLTCYSSHLRPNRGSCGEIPPLGRLLTIRGSSGRFPIDSAARPSKILFITPPYHCGVAEISGRWLPLNFVSLAGAARRSGLLVEIYDAMAMDHGYPEIEERLRASGATYLATSALTATITEALKILELAKRVTPAAIKVASLETAVRPPWIISWWGRGRSPLLTSSRPWRGRASRQRSRASPSGGGESSSLPPDVLSWRVSTTSPWRGICWSGSGIRTSSSPVPVWGQSPPPGGVTGRAASVPSSSSGSTPGGGELPERLLRSWNYSTRPMG